MLRPLVGAMRNPTVKPEVRGHFWQWNRDRFAANRRSYIAPRRVAAKQHAPTPYRTPSQDGLGLTWAGAEQDALWCGAWWKGVDRDVVVPMVDYAGHLMVELDELRFTEPAFEHTSLDVVEVLAAQLEYLGVTFDCGVIDDNDVHNSPPDPKGPVGLVLKASPVEFHGFQMQQFVVGDLSTQAAVKHGGG